MNAKSLIAAAAAMATALTAAGQSTFAESSICDGAGITLADGGGTATLQALCDRNDLTFFENGSSGKATVCIEASEPWFLTGVTVVAGDDTSAAPVSMWVYGRDGADDEWTRISNYSRMKYSGGPYTSYFGKVQSQTAFSEFRVDFEASGEKLRIAEFQLLGYPSRDDNNLATAANGRFSAPANVSGTEALGIAGDITPVTMKGARQGNDLRDSWIDYTFDEPVAISSYGITSNSAARGSMRPSAWDLMASADGVEWVTLDRRCNEENFGFSNYMQRFSLPSAGPVIDYAAVADKLLERMSGDFYREYFGGRYLIHSWHPDPSKLGTSYDYWWQAHAVDACVDAYKRTGKRIWNTRAAQIKKGMYTAYDASRQDLWNAFYDDMEWMAIACTRAAETLPNASEWLSEAKQLFEWIWGGWSDVDGGGISWNCNDGRDSKNSCSNAPAMIAATHLYRLTGEQHYLDKAIMIFDWMLTHSRFDDGFIKDSPHNDNRGWTFSYNQGTWVGGLLELYKITGEQKYRDIAIDLLDKCIDGNWYSPAGIMREQGDGDGGLFKGIFIRYIAEWILSGKLDSERQYRYAKYFVENAKSLYMSSLIKPDYQVMPCWRSRGANFNGSVNGAPDGSYHASILLSGIFLFEGVDRMQRAGLLDGNAVVNPNIGKKYRHYRLRVTDNGGSDDVELCGFSLYGAPSAGVADVRTGRNGVTMSSARGTISLGGLVPGARVSVHSPSGTTAAAATASDSSISMAVAPGLYIVSVSGPMAAAGKIIVK